MPSERVLVGRFGAPHGVKGELRLKSFTADPRAIVTYGPLFDAAGLRRFELTALRVVKDDLCVVGVQGIGSRSAAEALTNLDLFVPRARLPEAAEEEFYHADLVGLAVHDGSGALLGQVVAVRNFGGGDILEIAPTGGGDTLLFAFTRQVVPVVDVKAGHVIVNPPVEIDGEAQDD